MLQDLPKSERPREKLVSEGSRSLSNAELIAVLISSGSEGESAVSLASRILSLEEGSISKLSDYEPEEFMKLKGVGIAKACSLVAAMELGRRIATSPKADVIDLKDPENVAALFMEDMRYLNREIIRIAMLNNHFGLIGKADVSVGGLAEASAHPREIFAGAIRKGAAGIVMAHNHPSGECTPSDADIISTVQIVKSGQILGIPVYDHLIIGDGCYTSLYENRPELFSD